MKRSVTFDAGVARRFEWESTINITGLKERDVHPMIAEMARYACELAGKDPLPCRSRMKIDFAKMSAVLDNVFLVDVVSDGEDYYFKYFGETMHIMCGINLCGHLLSDVDDAGMRNSFKASYDEAVKSRAPLFLKGYYAWMRAKIPIERLLVPIVDEDGAVIALCGISVPLVGKDEVKRFAGKGPAKLIGKDEVLTAA